APGVKHQQRWLAGVMRKGVGQNRIDMGLGLTA
ncbi:MAG: hypothetical protein RL748_1049, partial [Pseudomonadota bacterium]